jgi:GTP pyrophosphokinase
MPHGERFYDALAYAARLHAAQRRKGSDTPYVAHLLSVAALVIEQGGDEDEAIAALLHDAVEDQGGAAQLAEIRRRYGERVAAIVAGCTDAEIIPKPPWRERKLAYLARLPHESRSVRLVSAADKLHNVRSLVEDYRALGESVWQRFNGGREGTLWYYRTVTTILSESGDVPLAAPLARVVEELEALAAMRESQKSPD